LGPNHRFLNLGPMIKLPFLPSSPQGQKKRGPKSGTLPFGPCFSRDSKLRRKIEWAQNPDFTIWAHSPLHHQTREGKRVGPKLIFCILGPNHRFDISLRFNLYLHTLIAHTQHNHNIKPAGGFLRPPAGFLLPRFC